MAGLVTHRQRPPTAGGVCFLKIEDETGNLSINLPAATWESTTRRTRESSVLVVHGTIQIPRTAPCTSWRGRLLRFTLHAKDRCRSYR
ncbi:OB-fold nucleic acid binding domain-containing protein [Catenulispora sp. GAS73]|uniref:OB-fold nucleic acid binding domain-containing protein n=1 Tax=Catenulispora sp. GAS73 TaxID=3156269 RepID=UPI003517EE4C